MTPNRAKHQDTDLNKLVQFRLIKQNQSSLVLDLYKMFVFYYFLRFSASFHIFPMYCSESQNLN